MPPKNLKKPQTGGKKPNKLNPEARPALDVVVTETAKKDTVAKQAVLGYARLNVIKCKDKLVFGAWNSRPVVQSQVESIIKSFFVNGADRFNSLHAIPLVIKKSDIVEGSYEDDLNKQDELPELLFTRDTDDFRIHAAGGQHRTKAIQEWVVHLQSEHNSLVVEEKRFRKHNLGTSREDMDYIDKLVARRERLACVLAYNGQWLVTLYDSDKVNHITGLHISKNETKHVYMESPEEGLMQKYKIMVAEGKGPRTVEPPVVKKGPAFKQYSLLVQDYSFLCLGYLTSSGTHYLRIPELRLNRFHEIMFSSYGGLVSDLTKRLEDKLRACFNDIPFTRVEYDRHVNNITKGNSFANESAIALEEKYIALCKADAVCEAITDSLRTTLDDVYVKFLGGEGATSYRFGNMDDDIWMKAWESYVFTTVTVMEDYVQDLLKSGAMKTLSEVAQKALSNCAAKAALILNRRESPIVEFQLFPFMSCSVFKTLVRNFEMIEKSILEVSLWYSPYIAMAKSHGKDWDPGSASADMIRAVMAHPDYTPKDRSKALASIINLFFSHFAAFLHMEGQLSRIDVPARVTQQKELLKYFGLSDAANNTKLLTRGKTGKGKGRETEEEGDQDEGEEDEFYVAKATNDTEDEAIGEQDGNGSDKNMATSESCQMNAMQVQKDNVQDTERLKSLRLEALDAQRLLNAGAKISPDKNPALYSVWTRQSKISEDATPDSFRGQAAVGWHTFEWASKTGSSRTRTMRLMACIAIMEQAIVNRYRAELLGGHRSAAAYIRFTIEGNTLHFRIKRANPHKSKHIQLTAALPDSLARSIPSCYAPLEWADGLSYDNENLSSLEFDIEEELQVQKHHKIREKQSVKVQKIINEVQNARVAWADTTGLSAVRGQPALHGGVHQALEALVQALQLNAYRQRYPKQAQIFTSSAALPPYEHLMITLRGTGSMTDMDRAMRTIKPILPSREEERVLASNADLHLGTRKAKKTVEPGEDIETLVHGEAGGAIFKGFDGPPDVNGGEPEVTEATTLPVNLHGASGSGNIAEEEGTNSKRFSIATTMLLTESTLSDAEPDKPPITGDDKNLLQTGCGPRPRPQVIGPRQSGSKMAGNSPMEVLHASKPAKRRAASAELEEQDAGDGYPRKRGPGWQAGTSAGSAGWGLEQFDEVEDVAHELA
ncbi:hypothetical protein BDN67DRAFT_1072862 [Paxillus ammoniavirescens]|nr:hypothetical protein BDN67DRAFT_1072862 [Paxillus ammoniavirescens]